MKRFVIKTYSVNYFLLILCSLLLAAVGCQGQPEGINKENVSDNDVEGNIVLDDNEGVAYNPNIDPANFVQTIDHPYFTLTPGTIWVYEGENDEGLAERIEVEVTQDTKTIMGVTTTVVRDRVWLEGELIEDTFDWYAQDSEGNVWYFGEDTKEFEDGEVVSTAGSWEAGVDGAEPGIIMEADPQVGDAYRQEFFKGEAEDMGEVLSVDESVTIDMGRFENCIQVKDWTPLEPDIVEHKFYCREAGNMVFENKVAGDSGKLALVEVKSS